MNWKKIKHYEEYEINSIGQVRRNSKLLKPQMASNGYVNICLCKKGKAKQFRLHRLLAESFIPNPLNKPQINHIDGIRTNNNLSNLEWVIVSENRLHACRVTKNHKPPRSMLGKFGKNHNISKQFKIKFPDGSIIEYGSGLEFTRLTGFDHTSISWARTKKSSPYTFSHGKIKGLTVYFD
jgi:hypothetical protein